MGVLCPLGNDVRSTWNAMLEGESGIGLITQFGHASRQQGLELFVQHLLEGVGRGRARSGKAGQRSLDMTAKAFIWPPRT